MLPTQCPLPQLHKVLPTRGQGPRGHRPGLHACTKGLPWFWPRRAPGQRMGAAEAGLPFPVAVLQVETSSRRAPGLPVL